MDYTFEVSTLALDAQLASVDVLRIVVIEPTPLALDAELGDIELTQRLSLEVSALGLTAALGGVELLCNRVLQAGPLEIPAGLPGAALRWDPLILRVATAAGSLQLRPLQVIQSTLFQIEALPLTVDVAVVDFAKADAFSINPLALTLGLRQATFKRGVPAWLIERLYIPTGFRSVNITFISYYQIPQLIPSGREFVPPSYSLTETRAQSGNTKKRLWASRPGGGSLKLSFTNISDADAQLLTAIWDRAKGRRYSVVLPSRMFRGMSQALQSHLELNGLPLTWGFSRQPTVQSVIPGISSVELEFTARGYGGQSLPVITTPDPPREWIVSALQLAALPLPSVSIIYVRILVFTSSTLALQIGLGVVQIKTSPVFNVGVIQLGVNVNSIDITYGDAYADNVVLLLDMEGANNSTTFTDVSKYALPVTRQGSAIISTEDSVERGSSAKFTTTADYLSVPNNTVAGSPAFAFGSGDFTIEAWVLPLNPTANPFGVERVIVGYWSATSSSSQAFYLAISGGAIFFIADIPNDTTIFSTGSVIKEPRWYHIAVARVGATIRLFVNGQIIQTYNIGTTAIVTGSNTLGVGGYNRGTGDKGSFFGYIDYVRITRGVGRYSTAFSVAVPPRSFKPSRLAMSVGNGLTGFYFSRNEPSDQSFNSVRILLFCEAADNTTTFVNFAPTQLAVTANGNARISTSQSKWGSASAYFDGNGDFLSFSSISISGDACLEAWIRPASVSDNAIFGRDGGDNIQLLAINNSRLYCYWNGTEISGGTLVANTWYHVAVTRSSNIIRLFVNGTLVATSTANAQVVAISRIGYSIYRGWYNGFMDDIRITIGVARYTASFTPPTISFPAYFAREKLTISALALNNRLPPAGFYRKSVEPADPSFSNVSLLLPFTGVNQSTIFADNSSYGAVVTATGNAQISTAQSATGGSSALFDGTGDGLVINSANQFDFGSSDFTIELWVYPTALAGQSRCLLTKGWVSGTFAGPWLIYYDSTGNTYSFYSSADGTNWNIVSNLIIRSAPTLNTWAHIAVTRSGSTFRTFYNGVLTNSATSSATVIANANHKVGIGADANGTANGFAGYIDEVRLTKGIARYTSSFTPSTTPFPVY